MNAIDNEKIDLSMMNDVTLDINGRYEAGERNFQDTEQWFVLLCDDAEYMKKLNISLNDDSIIMDIIDENQLVGKVIFSKDIRQKEKFKDRLILCTTIIFTCMMLCLLIALIYFYRDVIKPFSKLKVFAKDIAAGNFEAPLHMHKNNYFGAFTESFDLMRDELSRARKSEYEANKSKKELVASLSHDIKTPVSTIKAVCEVLEVKLSDEDCKQKVETISMKADLIDHLVSDMFHATLEELNMLKIQPKETDSRILQQAVKEIDNFGRLKEENELPGCLIWADSLRACQVVDNIISNAYKYSDGEVHVQYQVKDGFLLMRIRDFGEGVSEDDMPMICEKFYRGKNTENKGGSGLGLYISHQFMEGMKGFMDCYNESGFVVELRFLLV